MHCNIIIHNNNNNNNEIIMIMEESKTLFCSSNSHGISWKFVYHFCTRPQKVSPALT